ncbi:MAG TPA: hypothetical protein VIO60_00965 [Rectinemataceae bacterium]
MPERSLSRAARFAAVFFLALGLGSCALGSGDGASAVQDELEDVPDAVFRGFIREEVRGSRIDFVAKADKAEYFRDKGLLIVYGLSFEDRGEDGVSVEASGRADKAVWHEDTGDAELSGSIRLYSTAEDASFETDSLSYRAASEALEGGPAESVIVRVGQRLFLHGKGFFADIDRRAFSFRGGVDGFARPGGTKE